MKNIDEIIVDIVEEQATENEVAVLLSAGTDSITCGIAAMRLGKKVTGYSIYINGQQTSDSLGAKDAADHFGWDFVGVDVPVDNIEEDFFTLINHYKCKKKTQVECTWPFMYVYPKIKEKVVLSGVAADGWYGVSKRANIHFKHTKELFDQFRNDYFGAPNPAGVRQQEQLAKENGMRLVAPYLEKSVAEWMMQHDWDFFNKPYQKSCIHDAFPEIRALKRRNHENLQLIAGIPDYFEKLLDNRKINPYNRERVMDLVRDWQNVGPKLF